MSKKHLPRISFCTTCKGRAGHLKKTIRQNLKDNADYANLEFVILDYNSQDGLGDWIKRNLADEIESGRVVYYFNPEPEFFRMAHAKNMAHRLATGDILVNLDADNFTGEGFAHFVAKKFLDSEKEGEHIFLRASENHLGPGKNLKNKMPIGSGGRIVVTREAFHLAGGYDEVFKTWSPDDKDFKLRLKNLGFERSGIKQKFLYSIGHSDKMRFESYDPDDIVTGKDLAKMFELKERQDHTIANNGQFGMGTVFRNFDMDNPIELRALPTRVFGIGMHKTATTSLAEALSILDIECAHYPSTKWALRVMKEMQKVGKSNTLERHYAACDIPIGIFFQELDKAYPGSKFILTTRDEDGWVESAKKHWALYKAGWDKRDPGSNELHKAIYGIADFDEGVFRARFKQHNTAVLKYFKDRPNDLLVMDMSRSPGWEELCQFLDKPEPNCQYPHKFATKDRMPSAGGGRS